MAVCLVSEPSKQCYTVEEVSICLNELMGFALYGKKTIARPEKPEVRDSLHQLCVCVPVVTPLFLVLRLLTILIRVSAHKIRSDSISSSVVSHYSDAVLSVNSQLPEPRIQAVLPSYQFVLNIAFFIAVHQTISKDISTPYSASFDFCPRDIEAS